MNTQSDAPLQRLHPLTLVLRFLRSIPALAVAVFSATAGIPDTAERMQSIGTIFFMVVYGAIALPLIVAHYLRFSYRITPREIIIRSGVFRRRKRNIPLERVQNVAIERSLLPRLLGLSSVKIMTAGSGEAEGMLKYTDHGAALSIRDMVRRRSESLVPEAPTEAEAPPAGRLLMAMPLRRVFLTGAFRFSFAYIAIIFSALAYAQQLGGVSEQDVVDWMFSAQAGALAEAASRLAWVIILGVAGLTCLLAWLTGMAATVARYYRFQLRRLDDKLVRSHGLFTLQEATIPLKRIQALAVRSNPLMRALGWFRLEMQTIGYDVSRRSGRVAIPLARIHEIAEAGTRIKPFDLPASYEKVSSLSIRRTFVRYAVALGILVVPVALLVSSLAYWGLLLLPFLGFMAWLQYRNHGYAITDDTLYVRRGVLQQYIWIVPFERFQGFRVNGTLFQRRLGLRTVSVDTAGAGYFRYPRIVDLPANAAGTVNDTLYAGLRRSVAPL